MSIGSIDLNSIMELVVTLAGLLWTYKSVRDAKESKDGKFIATVKAAWASVEGYSKKEKLPGAKKLAKALAEVEARWGALNPKYRALAELLLQQLSNAAKMGDGKTKMQHSGFGGAAWF